MRILIVGGGGREHALAYKIAQSPRVERIYCAPGNAGIAALAECVDIGVADTARLLSFARDRSIDFTVVGPEAPLVAGLADVFRAAGRKVFGPGAAAAALEGSKSFAKEIMRRYGVPTAAGRVFTAANEAYSYLDATPGPWVVKADGLAAGKGVVVTDDAAEAQRAVQSMMVDRVFGAAGDRILVEECLTGEEVSVLAFTDGRTVVPMLAAQDHKRVFDGDAGPNTGGMGAYAPAPVLTGELAAVVRDKILLPTIAGLAAEGIRFTGVLYAGLMITAQGPKVLEFNVRFGDPEAQPVLMLLASDLVEIMLAVEAGRLDQVPVRWREGAAVCVVLASGGYPGAYATGVPIEGLDRVPSPVTVFHAGTARDRDGRVVTAGGRVLGVTACGTDIAAACGLAYRGAAAISFAGMHYRHDIGCRALSKDGR